MAIGVHAVRITGDEPKKNRGKFGIVWTIEASIEGGDPTEVRFPANVIRELAELESVRNALLTIEVTGTGIDKRHRVMRIEKA